MHETEQTYRELYRTLTRKKQKFVSEYLVDCNAAKAARKAGYSVACARQIGHENLSKPDIAKAVQAGLDAIAVRCEVNADKLMRELATVAFSNIVHYRIDDEGHVSLEEGAPSEAIKAIQSVRRKKIVRGDGAVVYDSEFRLWDKIAALTLLGKKLKLFVERVEVENAQDQAYRLLLQQIREQPRQ
jgi:phage terminase small subunit